MAAAREVWPELPWTGWKDTCETLQLWSQIVGKVRVATTPWLNHSWHVPLYVSARGLTTSPIYVRGGVIEIELDFLAQAAVVRTGEGEERRIPLRPMPVRRFHGELMAALEEVGCPVDIDDHPNEIADPTPFSQDGARRDYDPEAARRFWRVLVQCDRVFKRFRTGFVGKASPVHFFWGSFDLAVTRFSGNPAPRHPGGVPNLPDEVCREAYSHEVSSAGFWPGGGPIDYPAFYSYAYPSNERFAAAEVQPPEAFWSRELGEFILPYDVVRLADDPDEVLTAFLQTAYEAAAGSLGWDREALECPIGSPRQPRMV